MTHLYDPSTRKAEAEGLPHFPGQCGLQGSERNTVPLKATSGWYEKGNVGRNVPQKEATTSECKRAGGSAPR